MHSMAERRFRVRWWHGLIVFVICLPLVGFLIAVISRNNGESRYAEAVAARQALGQPATVADFVALAPTVDTSIQDAWHAWQANYLKLPVIFMKAHTESWERFVPGTDEITIEIRDYVEGRRQVIAPARKLLRDPNLVISGFGFAAADLPPERRGILATSALRIPNLLATRHLAEWLAYEALSAADPLVALSDLDALLHKLDPPCTLIGTMIAVAISTIRDGAVFALCWRGDLPEHYRTAWLAETPHHLRWTARGFDSEICLLWGGVAHSLTNGELFGGLTASTPTLPWWLSRSGWQIWSQGFHECAIGITWIGAWSDRLEGRRPDALPMPTYGTLGPSPITAILLPNLSESATTALTATTRHRQIRLAVRIMSRPEVQLPADEVELGVRLSDAHVLDPGGDALALSYERLAPDRFRLSVNPHAPGPNIIEASRIADLGMSVGTPASSEPYVLDRAMVEVQVPNLTAAPETAPSLPPAP